MMHHKEYPLHANESMYFSELVAKSVFDANGNIDAVAKAWDMTETNVRYHMHRVAQDGDIDMPMRSRGSLRGANFWLERGFPWRIANEQALFEQCMIINRMREYKILYRTISDVVGCSCEQVSKLHKEQRYKNKPSPVVRWASERVGLIDVFKQLQKSEMNWTALAKMANR